jgi:hypothetical protein
MQLSVLVLVHMAIITSKIEAKRFIRAVKRREDDAKKLKYLNEVYKNVDDHLELLKEFKVKLEIK